MIRLVIVDDMPDIRNYLAEELAAASEQFSVVGAIRWFIRRKNPCAKSFPQSTARWYRSCQAR